jgi:PKD repeat protein
MPSAGLKGRAPARLALALLIASVLLCVHAGVASADPNWVLMNEQDQLADEFGSSDTVFITGSAVGGVGIIPAVDVYVVDNQSWADAEGDHLHDVSNPSHVPNTAVGFEVIDLPIWLPHLRVGAYDVVLDYNENGIYEDGIDDVIGIGADPGFTVFFDGDRSAIDKTALKEQYAKPWQTVAAFAHTMSTTVKAFQVVNQTSGALKFVEAGLILRDPPPPFVDDLPCATKSCGSVTHAAEWVGSNIQPLSTLWNGSPDPTGHLPTAAGLCHDRLEAAFPDQGLSCKVPISPTAALSSEAFGAGQLELVTDNLDRVLKGIAADPPDPNFTELWTYHPPATTFAPVAAESPAPQQATLANTVNRASLRSLGLLDSMQRFDGAVLAGDQVWAGRQAGDLATQTYALVEELKTLRDDAAALATAMRESGATGSDAGLGELQAHLQDGLTAEERAAFTDAGWSDEDIDRLVADLLETPAADLPEDLPAALDKIAEVTDPAIDALWDLAIYAEDISETAPTSAPPVASFTSTAPDPQHPRHIDFDASGSSDPDGDVTGWEWDFGDGSGSDEQKPQHVYAEPGSYLVTLTVTDDSGAEGTTAQWIGVSDAAPTASFTATPPAGPAPLSVAFDASESSDPDGTIDSYAWDFGDSTLGSGATATHTYAFPGTYEVRLTVTDDDGVTAETSQPVTVGTDGAPTATMTLTPDHGLAPLDVTADASGSTDAEGPIADWEWDFGDGTDSVTGEVVEHTFDAAGTYTVRLTVTDGSGAKATTTSSVVVSWPNRAPAPQDDSLAAIRAGALDVLANDFDPDGDALALTGSSDPAHGTVSCSVKGACTYKVDAGYTGPDSFTYTVADPAGLHATATVSVDASDPPVAGSGLSARDDHASGLAGHPIDVDVLHNDAGDAPLSVTGATDPGHGTIACDPGGTCHYVPATGFSGHDGFTYTVQDGSNRTATADVRLTVTAPAAGFSVAVDGAAHARSAASVTEGGDADWGVGVSSLPHDATQEQLDALPRPSLSATLEGRHELAAGSLKTAKGWTVEATGDDREVHAKAGADAVLGSVTESFAKPLPPISQGTGGDGHVPILVGSRVFAFYHHSNPTAVTCVDRRTGERCPGYPYTLNVASSSIIGPAAVVGSRIYVHAFTSVSFAQTASFGLFCWDAATDSTCGMVIAGRTPDASQPGGSAPVRVGGKIYFAGPDGDLHCVDPSTSASCASGATIPTGLSPGSEYDVITHGTQVYVAQHAGSVFCIDVAAGASCPGWSTPHAFSGLWNLVNWHDADGSIIGVCLVASGTGQCVRDGNPDDVTTITGWPTGDDYYDVTLEAETGTRTLIGSLGRGGVGCYDWTTLAPCTGGGYDGSGWLDVDSEGQSLPSAYGVAWDGSCAVALGDPGLVFTVDPAGSAPCNSLSSGAERRVVDLRDQRCDGGVGSATWSGVALADAGPDELDAVTVTVRDAATDAILATGDIVDGPLDLSGIDPKAHPAIAVDATARAAAGNAAWQDAVPPGLRISWKPDPRQLCFRTRTKLDCATEPAPIRVLAAVDGGAAVEEKVDVSRAAACAPKPKPAPSPTPTPVATPTPTPGPPDMTAAQLVLGCSNRRVVLEDVVADAGRVRLLGVADPSFAGRRVLLRFTATRKVVAKATVGADGLFSATAPLPPKGIRHSNRARYTASIGDERSLELKLERRMILKSVRVTAGSLVIAGQVTRPFANRAGDRRITVQRVLNCSQAKTVAIVSPSRSGRFRVVMKVPAGESAAVYRLRTRVRVPGRTRLADTFTLPRAVDLK